ncbi:hypothetical protein AYL99_10366 [Fonsecaea erecta]|uniref:F-box domain-containing protein n=1 Tax=Fonsecaea erecta TaxID=1367422 RepID=A0A178Z884_9EURO|nr:hypothetical protein AYL99_10366 [Fonsecaea erecta]OAP55393.1 hypothetical protein AYL99_10366 [Fonsecaea erecta]
MELVQLPNEVLSRILFFLDTPSPFDVGILQKPSWALIPFGSTSPTPAPSHCQHPLKNLALTCHFLRSLTLPVLFKHAVLHPHRLTDFLSFLERHSLARHVVSVAAALVLGHENHIYPPWWARLLNAVPVTRLSVLAPPEILAGLAGTCPWSSDAWAFDMEFQILQLDQTPEAALVTIDYDDLPDFLVARPWQNMVVNEGSSLLAYTTYEYFLRRTPSVLTALHWNDSAAGNALFANLQSFAFVAIFPFYNHVDEVFKCVRKMRQLRRLFVKLCPEPRSTVFRDEIERCDGALDVHDPWNECETSWLLIAQAVAFLTAEGQLRELQMDDIKIEGMRQTLEESIHSVLPPPPWRYEDSVNGIWRRRNDPAAAAGRLPLTILANTV